MLITRRQARRIALGHENDTVAGDALCARQNFFFTPAAPCRLGMDSNQVDSDECQVHFAGGAVALLGNNQLGAALQVGVVLLVDFLAEDECHHVGILLDGSRFAQIGQLRTVIAAPALRRAA